MARIPGIEMRAEQHDFLGAIRARKVRDDVRRALLRQIARGDTHPRAHRHAACDLPVEQIGVGIGDRDGGAAIAAAVTSTRRARREIDDVPTCGVER